MRTMYVGVRMGRRVEFVAHPRIIRLYCRSGECRNDDNSFIHSWMNDSGGGGDVRGNSCGGDVNRSKKEEEEQQQQVSIVSVSL
mmetsp:Transcript_5409/g.6584  ORF Transcript_5409/g.6584 Transcript_5409/m.6584 type:complete len:84 (-) Transcript_5409:88-339(-)